MKYKKTYIVCLVLLGWGFVWKFHPHLYQSKKTPVYHYEVISRYPHRQDAFTEGFEYHDGIIYEGTGLHGYSHIYKYTLETGEILKDYLLNPRYFGEGITVFGDALYQLTYRSGKGFIYNKDTFKPLDRFTYTNEGWGLTNDGDSLIRSDGSATLTFFDPKSLLTQRSITVHDTQGRINNLNELEYINGLIYANIWKTNRIAIIDPKQGAVMGYIDLTGLASRKKHKPNGIAYDPKTGHLLVTGKHWPYIYRIKIVA